MGRKCGWTECLTDLAALQLPLRPHPSERGRCPQEAVNIPGNEMQLQHFYSNGSSIFSGFAHLLCRSDFTGKKTKNQKAAPLFEFKDLHPDISQRKKPQHPLA